MHRSEKPAIAVYQTLPKIEDIPSPKQNGVNDLVISTDQTLAVSQYKIGFISVLQDRYVPDLPKPSDQKEGICSGWIFTACELSSLTGSGMLSDSLLAMSLALVAGERHDPEIATAGMRYYSRAMNKLRLELQPGLVTLGQLQLDISLVTCLAFATYEVSSFYEPDINTMLTRSR